MIIILVLYNKMYINQFYYHYYQNKNINSINKSLIKIYKKILMTFCVTNVFVYMTYLAQKLYK